MSTTVYDSPLGPLTLVAGAHGLREVRFPGAGDAPAAAGAAPEALRDACRQLDEYFAGEREAFHLALDLSGAPALELRVWEALREVPYGALTTYGDLARELGVPDAEPAAPGGRWLSAAQRVGRIVGSTPTPIVIPCHRVVGADGSLTGYGGGLERKRALLALERAGQLSLL